jgi:hypothetical protein
MMDRPSGIIDKFDAFPESSYREVDLTGLAAFSILRLHELNVPMTFENLVVALFKLFPAKFSLVDFAQYPDAARVGRTLLQLGPKYRNWARGSVQKGFVLTEAGVAKARSVANVIAGANVPKHQRTQHKPLPRTMDLSKDISTIEQSALYRKWINDGKISQSNSMELFDLLGAYAYTPSRVLRDRLKLLESTAIQVNRPDIVEFLNVVRKEFVQQFTT